jgi:hypothetical protein
MIIPLSNIEQAIAKSIARLRHQNARDKGIKNSKIGSQSNEETDLEGIGAELAFCKMFNIYPDLQVDHLPEEDALLRTGQKVDVKTTKYERGHLIVALWKKHKMDLYSLMVGKFPLYRFAGVIPAEKVFLPSNLKNFGYGNSYAVKQSELVSTDLYLDDDELDF